MDFLLNCQVANLLLRWVISLSKIIYLPINSRARDFNEIIIFFDARAIIAKYHESREDKKK
jgi:hypothetical protein